VHIGLCADDESIDAHSRPTMSKLTVYDVLAEPAPSTYRKERDTSAGWQKKPLEFFDSWKQGIVIENGLRARAQAGAPMEDYGATAGKAVFSEGERILVFQVRSGNAENVIVGAADASVDVRARCPAGPTIASPPLPHRLPHGH
jgi:hypothetical protein